jgi:GT2 family glycosyltransferase
MKIATIIQTFKRKDYLKEQIAAVKSQTVKSDEIIIVHNEGDVKIKFPKVDRYFYANPNHFFHYRYSIALLLEADYISMLDDDTILQPNWYKNCLETIKQYNCICVSNGRIVDRKNRRQFGMGWGVPNEIPMKVDFGGHSLFFKKEVLKYMWQDEIMNYQNGEDIMLSANAQIYGGIQTYVPPHPKDDLSQWGSHPEKAAKYGSDPVSSWLVRREVHTLERQKLFDQYVEKGWKLVLEENN